MRITVLDGHTLNPGDLSWEGLEALGAVVVHPRTAPGEVLERSRDAEALLTNKVRLDAATIAALPRLRYIGVIATGVNIVDLGAAEARGIAVCNVPGYSTASVAQLTIALLMELSLRPGLHSQGVRAGRWAASPDFSYADAPLIELAGLTLGLVGYGAIGRAVAGVARALGMRVQVATRTPPADGTVCVDVDALFSGSDVVSLHCPLTPQTGRLVDARRLGLMRRGALLINTGRGQLLDEAAVAAALASGQLGGCAVDVLTQEPPQPDHPLVTAPNSVVTPHIGWATLAARRRLMAEVVANLAAWQAGTPRNVVGP